MKVSFEYTKEEYKKYLLKSRLVNNIILFIIGLIIVIILLNLLYVFAQNKVNEMLNYNVYGKYTLELTPNKFSVTVNKSKSDYKYNQVKKIVERRNEFMVKFKKTREYLIFEKKFFTEEEYNKVINMFKEKIN